MDMDVIERADRVSPRTQKTLAIFRRIQDKRRAGGLPNFNYSWTPGGENRGTPQERQMVSEAENEIGIEFAQRLEASK